MNTNFSKAMYFLLAFILCFGLAACGVSKEVKTTTDMISQIGKVSIDKTEQILAAEDAYNALSEKQKAQVENYQTLVDAKEELVFLYGKSTFNDVNKAVELTISVMDSIYSAWHYGIFDGDDATVQGLAEKANVDEDQLKTAIKAYGYDTDSKQNYFLRKEWSNCVSIIGDIYKANGTVDEISRLLGSSKSSLKSMSEEFSDYEYYPKLKDYYSKANSYYDFAVSPTGSFNQLADTINDYENPLRTYKEDLDFVFTK